MQSTQYQQGNDTTLRQQKHSGIGFFAASRSKIVFRAASRASLAFRSVLAMSRLKKMRWTLNMLWFGVCGVPKSGRSLGVITELRHSGSEQRSKVFLK